MKLTRYARSMRHRPTREEALVWRWLRDRRFGDLKLRRQYPIGGYIADFYCMDLELVIELDGRGHAEFAQDLYDVTRDFEMSKLGVTVVRIRNDVVREQPDAAADAILAAVENLRPSSGLRPPSPAGRRL